MSTDTWLADTRTSYDTVADNYADLVRDALAEHQYLRAALTLFHVGDRSQLKTEGYGGHPMKVHVHRRQPDKVAAWLRDAGFEVEAQLLLNNPDGEVAQAVLFARRNLDA